MYLHGQFAAYHARQYLLAKISFGHLFGVRFAPFKLFVVFLRLYQRLAHKGGRSHSGRRCLVLPIIYPLGVFAKGLYGYGKAQYHVIYTVAIRLYRHELSAYNVRAAGACHAGGHAARSRFLKATIVWIYGIYRPKLGSYGICAFIPVRAFKAHCILPHAYMAMRINYAGHNGHAGNVAHFRIAVRKILAHGDYFAVFYSHVAHKSRACHSHHVSVFQYKHFTYPP